MPVVMMDPQNTYGLSGEAVEYIGPRPPRNRFGVTFVHAAHLDPEAALRVAAKHCCLPDLPPLLGEVPTSYSRHSRAVLWGCDADDMAGVQVVGWAPSMRLQDVLGARKRCQQMLDPVTAATGLKATYRVNPATGQITAAVSGEKTLRIDTDHEIVPRHIPQGFAVNWATRTLHRHTCGLTHRIGGSRGGGACDPVYTSVWRPTLGMDRSAALALSALVGLSLCKSCVPAGAGVGAQMVSRKAKASAA